MNNKIEYILCAAIHYNDGKEYTFSPTQIGYVVCGKRHGDCMETRFALTGKPTGDNDREGFLTSKNRFVNRTEALQIAIKAEQVKAEDCSSKLLSEDLY